MGWKRTCNCKLPGAFGAITFCDGVLLLNEPVCVGCGTHWVQKIEKKCEKEKLTSKILRALHRKGKLVCLNPN